MNSRELERRADAQEAAIHSASRDFDGMPLVIADVPTWTEIMPREDVAFGRKAQRVWRVIIAPSRALAVGFLRLTESWFTFALVLMSVATVVVIYVTR